MAAAASAALRAAGYGDGDGGAPAADGSAPLSPYAAAALALIHVSLWQRLLEWAGVPDTWPSGVGKRDDELASA